MRHNDPLRIDRRHSVRCELGWRRDALHRAIQAAAEADCQGAIPGPAGEQQQGTRVRGGVVGHQRRESFEGSEMNLPISSLTTSGSE